MRGTFLIFKNMANFSISNLVKAQALLNANFQNPELRPQESPILSLGTRNSSILIQNHSELRTREDRPIEAYILKRTKRTTTGLQRTHNHTGNRGDSIAKELLWTPFVDKFSFSLKQMDNNVFNAEVALANQFSQAFMNIREDVEIFLRDLLLSEITQVNNAAGVGSWNATDFVFEIMSSPDKGLYFENAKSMMRQNDYTGTYDVITDPIAYVMARFYAAQGAANATNTSFQFSGMNIVESNSLSMTDYNTGLSLFLPVNTFGVLDWIPRQNREGSGDYNTVLGGFGSMRDPVSGLVFAVHGYAERANTSSSNGNTQDVEIQFEVSIDLSANLAPLSNEDETVVFATANV
jgi:hypothetical protein